MCIEILSDILGAGLAALPPVAVPVGAVRAALAFLAAGDFLQAIGYGAEGVRLQHLAVGWEIFFLWGIFSLRDEPLH